MAFVHGKGTVVSVDANDMGPFGTSCEFEIKAEAHDVTTYGNDWKVFSGGLKESSLKMEGNYDDAAAGPRATLEDLVGTVIEVIYSPEGAGTGKPTRTFNGLMTSYNEVAPVADMIKFTAQFQGSGEVATTTA
jgi:hypothetical protein